MTRSSSYKPIPLDIAVIHAVRQQESPRILIGNFLDDWLRFPDPIIRQSLIEQPIPDNSDEEWHRWGAFIAALVEYLTRQNNIPTPSWVFEECWTLHTPWFLNPYWKLRAWLLVATPPEWKRRRIFGGDETMMVGRV